MIDVDLVLEFLLEVPNDLNPLNEDLLRPDPKGRGSIVKLFPIVHAISAAFFFHHLG